MTYAEIIARPCPAATWVRWVIEMHEPMVREEVEHFAGGWKPGSAWRYATGAASDAGYAPGENENVWIPQEK
jgi:hypothetical protein